MQIPSSHQNLLAHLNVTSPHFLGRGMEGYVYDYSPHEIIKIWINSYSDINTLNERKIFYDEINQHNLNFSIPKIYSIGDYLGSFYSIEKKLVGERGDMFYVRSSQDNKTRLLMNYFKILFELENLTINGNYGELIQGSQTRTTNEIWTDFLRVKLEQTKARCISHPDHDLTGVSEIIDKFFIEELPHIPRKPDKHLVHGDLFLENVLVKENGEISALLDFGPLTLIGDHLMDVAGLVHLVTVSPDIDSNARVYLESIAREQFSGKEDIIRAYLQYYSLLFINSKSYDPSTYMWCKENLRQNGYFV